MIVTVQGETIMWRPGILLLALAMLSAPPAGAEVYKCTVDGKIVYADRPCAPGGAEKKIAVDPVPPTTGPTRDFAKENAEASQRLKAKIGGDLAERNAYRESQRKHYLKCREFTDAIAREQAWRAARSTAVRQRAETEIAIQTRNYYEAGCGD